MGQLLFLCFASDLLPSAPVYCQSVVALTPYVIPPYDCLSPTQFFTLCGVICLTSLRDVPPVADNSFLLGTLRLSADDLLGFVSLCRGSVQPQRRRSFLYSLFHLDSCFLFPPYILPSLSSRRFFPRPRVEAPSFPADFFPIRACVSPFPPLFTLPFLYLYVLPCLDFETKQGLPAPSRQLLSFFFPPFLSFHRGFVLQATNPCCFNRIVSPCTPYLLFRRSFFASSFSPLKRYAILTPPKCHSLPLNPLMRPCPSSLPVFATLAYLFLQRFLLSKCFCYI